MLYYCIYLASSGLLFVVDSLQSGDLRALFVCLSTRCIGLSF